MPVFELLVAIEIAAFLFGLVVGSFANVCIHRIPIEQSVVSPPSRCPRCLTRIAPWNNLPLLSWLFLRGRCVSCGEPISFRYPAIEAIHGFGFAAIVYLHGVTAYLPVLCVFFSALVILAMIDWDHQILPDTITIPGVVAGVASTLIPGALVSWKESLIAATLGFVGFFLVAEGYARLRGIEGLGMGDWKLAAFMGSVLGPRRLLLVVFLGSLSGMVFGIAAALRERRQLQPAVPILESGKPETATPGSGVETTLAESGGDGPAPESSGAAESDHQETSLGKYRLPFGTFLAASAIFVLFFGDRVILWYSALLRG
jgi:leader peptidase (prepilin peptidase) / N-methyltransferase